MKPQIKIITTYLGQASEINYYQEHEDRVNEFVQEETSSTISINTQLNPSFTVHLKARVTETYYPCLITTISYIPIIKTDGTE